MNKELEALKRIKNHTLSYTGEFYKTLTDSRAKELEDLDIIESALKSQQRKLDLISEVLVDVSKGNYADLNDAINEIRETLENE